MFEHVGINNFPTCFGTVRRVLKPDGLFLNHGITSDTGWQRSPLTRFMNRYIFTLFPACCDILQNTLR